MATALHIVVIAGLIGAGLVYLFVILAAWGSSARKDDRARREAQREQDVARAIEAAWMHVERMREAEHSPVKGGRK